jgi:hypothetical protein
MVRLLMVAYLMAHGFVHVAIYVLPTDPAKPRPFDPHRSWALTHIHAPAETALASSHLLAWMTAGAFTTTALVLALGAGWWPVAAALSAGLGLVFKTMWFHPWLSAGVALDIGLVAAVAAQWPASLY